MQTLQQKYVLTPHGARLATFVTLLNKLEKRASKIVFAGRRETCATIAEMLRSLGNRCVALHGQLPQRERLKALSKFKSGDVPLLIATGAQRGGGSAFAYKPERRRREREGGGSGAGKR